MHFFCRGYKAWKYYSGSFQASPSSHSLINANQLKRREQRKGCFTLLLLYKNWIKINKQQTKLVDALNYVLQHFTPVEIMSWPTDKDNNTNSINTNAKYIYMLFALLPGGVIIILNNALKITLNIFENVFFLERTAARASTMNLYIISETFHVLLENRAWRILSRPPRTLF